MFCEKGRARKLEPAPNNCTFFVPHILIWDSCHEGVLRWHQKLQDINRMKQSQGHCPAECLTSPVSLSPGSQLFDLLSPGWCVRAEAGLDTWHWDTLWLLPPQMCSPAFPSSYVTTSSGEHFLDLFLSCCSSELIPELTIGTCSEISALQVCLGSSQRLLSCARWCRNNLWIVPGLVVTPHPQSSSAFHPWGHVTVVSHYLESPKQKVMGIKQHTLEKTLG